MQDSLHSSHYRCSYLSRRDTQQLFCCGQQSVAIIERMDRYHKSQPAESIVATSLALIRLRHASNCVSYKAKSWSKPRPKITSLS